MTASLSYHGQYVWKCMVSLSYGSQYVLRWPEGLIWRPVCLMKVSYVSWCSIAGISIENQKLSFSRGDYFEKGCSATWSKSNNAFFRLNSDLFGFTTVTTLSTIYWTELEPSHTIASQGIKLHFKNALFFSLKKKIIRTWETTWKNLYHHEPGLRRKVGWENWS